jgi:hypothetical protein
VAARVNRRTAPSIIVFITGLIAAVWSGIATYRAVGIYGGPIATGFHREWNPQTRRYELIHETTNANGVHVRRLFTDDLRQLLQTEISGGGIESPLTFAGADEAPKRVGFSSINDGVIDAWAMADPKTGSTRVEISTKRNGKIDRWERYEKGQLVRVDLDTNGNGKPDRWQTYEDGILMDTFIDVNENGQPDGFPSR